MQRKYFGFAVAGVVMALQWAASPGAAAGGGGGRGMQMSGGRVSGAQFSGARGSGGGAFFSPTERAPEGSGYGYTHYYSGYGATAASGYGAQPRQDRATSRNSAVVPPPVAELNPDSQNTAAGNSAALNANSRNAAGTPGSNAAASNAGINTANHPITRANQWRHDPGHPYHHRHFVALNNGIFLLDEGLYDTDQDFYAGYAGSDDFAYAYDDGYYDTFDPSVVGVVETRLAGEGYYNGAIDNKLKPGLRDAIAKYQQEHGLAVTGQIDEPLLNELGLL